jgi:iron complex outermembrane receptor protein
VSIAGKSTVEVSLGTSSVSNLNEVVVTGYGTRKIKDATGSVAAITPKDFNKGVISTPEQLIQGRTPGVIVTPSSGEPGAAATINIRGSSSIRGNNDPLFVVDGVPLDPGGTAGTSSGIEGSSTPKNPLMFLNPNDIESISILKDASSAAIYGSRGANGVVIITTKSGKGRKGAFSFNASTSISRPASRYDLLNATDFLAAVRKANIDAGTSPADAAEAVKLVDKGHNTNWQDEIFQTGVSQNYNLSWGFNNKGANLRVSGSYDKQEGIVKTSQLERMTGRANFSQKFYKDKFKVDVTATYSNVKNGYAPNTNNAGYQGSLIGATITFNPTYPIYNTNGSFYDPGDGNRNPVQMLNYFTDNDKINRFLTNFSLSWEILKGLVYKGTFGYDKSSFVRKSFADPRLGSSAYGGTTNVNGRDLQNSIFGNGRAVQQDLDLSTLLVEHTVTWDKVLNNGHVVNAVGGYSYQRYKNEYMAQLGWGLATPVVGPKDVFVKNMANFTKHDSYIPYFSKEELQSFFGRVNYTIAEKYFLTATFRADGSSKFGKNNKYGYFPAFAAKWRLIKEDFASSLTNVFDELSLRVNYGKLGSQDGLPPYKSLGVRQIYVGSGGGLDTSVINEANPDLRWEEATTTGAGLDFGIFRNRLTGTVDFYLTRRKNLLFLKASAGGFGATTNIWVNLPGVVKNKGLEVSLNFLAIPKKRKFGWDINYNMTFMSNKMTEFNQIVNTGAVNGQGLSGAYAQTIQNGYPLFTFKMPIFQGFDGNGDARYANGAQDALVGSALPKFSAGLTNNFSLGKWSASVFLNASTGFWVYNNTANALFLKGSIKTAHNITYAVANSNEDPINPGSVSTRFLEKGDFVRLSNVNLSYTFALNSKTIKSLSAFASGQNLALWTGYSGLDPEVNVDHSLGGIPSRGFDYAGYPKSRTFTLGINLGF